MESDWTIRPSLCTIPHPMWMLAEMSPLTAAGVMIALGAFGLYAASRFAADALARGTDTYRPGRLALGHWVPIVTVACWAAAQRRADLAVGVVFGTSVAALSLALGMVTYLAPPGVLPPSRRAWPFVMAAGVFALVAGFGGSVGPLHALMLLVMGSAILGVWRGAGAEEATVAQVLADLAEPLQPPPAGELALRAAQWVLAVALAAAGAKAAVDGAIVTDASTRLLRASLLAAGVLSPLLTLPVLATGTDLAQRGRSAEACGTLVGVALLNLCALLPAIALLWYLRSAWPALWEGGGVWRTLLRVRERGEPIPLPLTVWRIDVVVVVVLGFMLIPVAVGRWAIARLESLGLILAYAAYLVAVASVSIRL